MYPYQVRDKISGHLVTEETDTEAVISFLRARNPAAYTIYRVTPKTSEVRSIIGGKRWLSANSKHAKC